MKLVTVGPANARRPGEGSGYIRGDLQENLRLTRLALELCERPSWINVNAWVTPTVDVKGGVPTPYFPSGLLMRLCSRGLRDAIDRSRSDLDVVQWLPVRVVDEEGTNYDYSILHFPEAPARTDEALQQRGGDAPVFGYYDAHDINGRRVLPPPGPQMVFFVVASDVVPDLLAAGLTQHNFFPVPGFE